MKIKTEFIILEKIKYDNYLSDISNPYPGILGFSGEKSLSAKGDFMIVKVALGFDPESEGFDYYALVRSEFAGGYACNTEVYEMTHNKIEGAFYQGIVGLDMDATMKVKDHLMRVVSYLNIVKNFISGGSYSVHYIAENTQKITSKLDIVLFDDTPEPKPTKKGVKNGNKIINCNVRH